MSYWNRPTSTSSPSLDTTSLAGGIRSKVKSTSDEFYEIEPAIILDIILDINHPYIKQKQYKLTPEQWPVDINGKKPTNSDLDYTWVGRALIRFIYSQKSVQKEDLIWAIPLESNISEYPVLNEIVGVVFYLGQYYYTRKINQFNTPNADVDFNFEIVNGGFRETPNSIVQGNRELVVNSTDLKRPYVGPPSKLNNLGSIGYTGTMGRYFLYNPKIRSLKRREGDMVFESRFGQSIRFGAYDDDRRNDISDQTYTDYFNTNNPLNPYSGTKSGGGNPMIIIRNRQRSLNKNNIDEKNVGGYLLEDINNDGSSIHLTSGLTLSGFQTTCKKKMWGTGEEQSGFNGTTSFIYPKLLGDQIVINTDRIVIQARKNEMFHYSKKRMAFVTDDEYTIDAQNQIVITTNNKTVINSPAIYLGEYNQTAEPVLLGQTTVNWLYDFCNWTLAHAHWFTHNHPDAQGGTTGAANPNQTQTTIQAASLIVLRDTLNLLMSRRVFTVGGGFAPGKNGGSISNGVSPISIAVPAGNGVPGEFNGVNHR